MEAMAQLGILMAATVLAAGTAFGMAWAFLQGAFRLMQPAAAGTRVQKANSAHPSVRPRLQLVEGTRAAARSFGSG